MIEIENKIPEMLKISMIESNNGQIEGLPKNPRLWEDYEIDNLVASIEQTPELLEARPIIVVKRSLKKYVTLGGNMRLAALKKINISYEIYKQWLKNID